MLAELRIGLSPTSYNRGGRLGCGFSCGSKRPRSLPPFYTDSNHFLDYFPLLGWIYRRAHELIRSDDWIMVQLWRLGVTECEHGEHFTCELLGGI
jgi:hypothetical protein